MFNLSDSPLLRQLQQRFLKLANISSEDATSVRDLIAELFFAQQTMNGVSKIVTIEAMLDTSIQTLQAQGNGLIGGTETGAPITLFPPYIAFRVIYEQLMQLATSLRQRCHWSLPSTQALSTIAWQFSGGELSEEQKIAAFSAACQPFTIITGGAGTGKTTTLTKAMELLLLDDGELDILLAAPTGKAAQRLNESLSAQLPNVHTSVREKVAKLHATTLHRLLGVSETTGEAFRNANNPLSCQVLAIDESSMIGSDLLAQVFAALSPDTKLILLGDANQLPPINSVAFFNEMSCLEAKKSRDFSHAIAQYLDCRIPDTLIDDNAPLTNQVCRLTTARRFAEKSLIEASAEAILSRDLDLFAHVLGTHWQMMPAPSTLYATLANRYPNTRDALLENLPTRMILCANRQGYWGSEAINAHLDQVFRARILGNVKKSRDFFSAHSEWYEGRQILIEKNHLDLGLNNGDIGRCYPRDGQWFIHFGEGRDLPVTLLPTDYSLAFAMTIHKSQGSEYAHIDMVLDRHQTDNPNLLITPALLYTGITRAKQSLAIFGDKGTIAEAFRGDVVQGDSPLLSLL